MTTTQDRRYRNPFPTVDIIIEIDNRVVLVERRNPPRGWAIPGGFVDEGESVEEAAIREAREETGLEVHLTDLFYVYSDPRRDPRHHTMSTVFVGRAFGHPVAGDDAGKTGLFDRDHLPPLAFDHAMVLSDYFRWKDNGIRPSPQEMLDRSSRAPSNNAGAETVIRDNISPPDSETD